MQSKLSITRACQIAGLSRAAYYKRPTPAAERDAEVIDALNAIVAQHGRWGFWKCFTRLVHRGGYGLTPGVHLNRQFWVGSGWS